MTAKEIYKLITKIVGSIALLLGGLFVLVSPVGQLLIEKTGYVLP